MRLGKKLEKLEDNLRQSAVKNNFVPSVVKTKKLTLNFEKMIYNEEIEEAVLGALLIDTAVAGEVLGGLNPDMFYIEKHRLIYEAVVSAFNANKPIDILVVTEELRQLGTLERAGGPLGVVTVTRTMLSSAHIQRHCLILYEYYVRRELWKILSAEIAGCEDMTVDVLEQVIRLQKELDLLLNRSPLESHLKRVDEVMELTMERIRRRVSGSRQGVTGIPTGIPKLDEITGGWQPGNLILTAARPGMGKTQLDLRFATTAAKEGYTVLFFTLEMMNVEVGERMLLVDSGIDYRPVKRGIVSESDMACLDLALKRVGGLPLYIDDTPYISIDQLCCIAKGMKAKRGVDLVIVDYLQLLGVVAKHGRTREQEVSECTRKLKSLARMLDCPVIVSSQLNRQVESSYDHRPELRHLRESGAIEQDADLVLMLWCPDNGGSPRRELIVAKNRHGEITQGKEGIEFG